MASRNYRTGVTAALMAFGTGRCYYPGCDVPLIKFVDDEPWLQLEIAHIRGLNPGSARYEIAMTDRDRNAFGNLVLLCAVHHKHVDRYPVEYSVADLLAWKATAEQETPSPFEGAVNIADDASLQALIDTQFAAGLDRLDRAVDRLEDLDKEAANLLRPLLQHLQAQQVSHPYLDEGIVLTLDDATRRLVEAEGIALSLDSASRRLQGIGDIVQQARSAATALNSAANRLAENR